MHRKRDFPHTDLCYLLVKIPREMTLETCNTYILNVKNTLL